MIMTEASSILFHYHSFLYASMWGSFCCHLVGYSDLSEQSLKALGLLGQRVKQVQHFFLNISGSTFADLQI